MREPRNYSSICRESFLVELTDCIPTEPQGTVWDVVVIGAGAGGGTAGYNLARLGRSVLFLERGKLPGQTGIDFEIASDLKSAHKIESGWWPHGVQCKGDFGVCQSDLLVGCGVGGSTALFSMVMDRFQPIDLRPSRFAPDGLNTSLPEEWPIQYDELEPYYRKAEALFRVRGTDDPLTPTGGPLLEPPLPSETETAVYDTLRQSGLHPYRLHHACEGTLNCDGCFGKLCPHACRNDAGRICVLPALQRHRAQILPNCHVVKLNASGRIVQSANCVWNGRHITIEARVFVLALHALLTPALLLRSANASFPAGLGNSSDLVGRNLMLHVSDSLLVSFGKRCGRPNACLHHGVSLNDFYTRGGIKLGNIQAHAGNSPNISDSPTLENNSADWVLFNTIVEDFPYLENRVIPKSGSNDEVYWEYTYPDELRYRSQMLVDAFVDALHPTCEVRVQKPSGGINGGHTCGTCRFGDDPHTSVLDRDNRIHDLDNVYVVDGSFFPSSGGINPCLTIVANSLRVSELIAQR